MSQHDLDHEVARALGEDVHEIRRRGFGLADPATVHFDPEPDDLPPQFLAWDDADYGLPTPVVASLEEYSKQAA